MQVIHQVVVRGQLDVHLIQVCVDILQDVHLLQIHVNEIRIHLNVPVILEAIHVLYVQIPVNVDVINFHMNVKFPPSTVQVRSLCRICHMSEI